jgi:hypothetical protein
MRCKKYPPSVLIVTEGEYSNVYSIDSFSLHGQGTAAVLLCFTAAFSGHPSK